VGVCVFVVEVSPDFFYWGVEDAFVSYVNHCRSSAITYDMNLTVTRNSSQWLGCL